MNFDNYTNIINDLYTKKGSLEVSLCVQVIKTPFSVDKNIVTNLDLYSFEDVYFTKCYAYYESNEKKATGFECLVLLNKQLKNEIKEGQYYTFKGRLLFFNNVPILYKAIITQKQQLIGLTKKDVKTPITKKIDKSLPFSVYYLPSILEVNKKIITPEKEKTEQYIKNWYNRGFNEARGIYSEKERFELEKQLKELFQEKNWVFSTKYLQLIDYLHYPILQIVNGTNQPDDITKQCLTYLIFIKIKLIAKKYKWGLTNKQIKNLAEEAWLPYMSNYLIAANYSTDLIILYHQSVLDTDPMFPVIDLTARTC